AQTNPAADQTWQVACGDGSSWPATSTPVPPTETATTIATSTPMPTGTNTTVPDTSTPTVTPPATSTPAQVTPTIPMVSEACQVIIDGNYDQNYPGWYWGVASFYAGETVVFSAGGALFNLDIYALSISEHGITTYTWIVPATGMYDIQFVSANFGNVSWDLTCS
ncbi:MAG TPA: hypothetical protein PK691_09755, partial [Thermomicrobiales bacterium]|nr:hypothetical protein [Thermomicrobiales bacterium]